MNEPTITVEWNTNRIELDSWIEKVKRPDGDYDLIGMGRKTEYSPDGVLLLEKIEPTGVTGWSPREAIEPEKPSFWRSLFGFK